jgi:hypothetical protein
MNFLRKISSNKGVLWITIAILVFGLPLISFAGVLDPIIGLLSQVFYLAFIYIPGWILALVTQVLVWVLRYQDFAHEEIITRGWTVLRDLSNMFFIIVLVVVAVGTIVKSGRYGYQQNLRRLILMAILINFSKTITLFFIDLSQAITISFVNAFLDAIQGGFPSLLGLTGVLSLQDADKLSVSGGLNVFLQIGLGGIMLLVAVVVVSVITFLFLMRIIFFAFLIILSPIAFLCSTLPTAQKYYHEWWDVLGKYLVLGPTLAFFLWLAFSVVQTGGTGQLSGQVYVNSGVSTVNLGASGTDSDPFLQNTGNTANTTQNPLAASLTRFFVAISLLFGSLMMAGRLGTVGAGISKQASGKLTGLGKSVLVGRSGAGGIVGTARSITAVPVRALGDFATNAMDSGTNKFSDFAGRAVGGATRFVTRNDRAAQVAGDIARAGVKGTTQAIGGAALSPYLRGMQAYTRADDTLRAKDVKFKAAEAKGKSEKEIYRGLSSLDGNAAQADAEQYVEKNMMNNPF